MHTIEAGRAAMGVVVGGLPAVMAGCAVQTAEPEEARLASGSSTECFGTGCNTVDNQICAAETRVATGGLGQSVTGDVATFELGLKSCGCTADGKSGDFVKHQEYDDNTGHTYWWTWCPASSQTTACTDAAGGLGTTYTLNGWISRFASWAPVDALKNDTLVTSCNVVPNGTYTVEVTWDPCPGGCLNSQ